MRKQVTEFSGSQATKYTKIPKQRDMILYSCFLTLLKISLRSLEVVGTRENGRARRGHARGEGAQSPLACLSLARPVSLSPTTS